MPRFEIRYGESWRDVSRRAGFHFFDVRCGDIEARLAVGLSDMVRLQWGLDNRAGAEQLERRVVVNHLKEHLASVTALTPHRVLLTAWDEPDLGEGWTVQRVGQELPYQWKECRYRLEKGGEYYCSAAKRDDDWAGRTTLAICQDCEMPSTDTACSNLVHPSTLSFRGMAGPPTRHLYDVQCQLGHPIDAHSAAECVLGERDCWVQTHQPEQPTQGTEPGERNLAAETLDMVDTLNLMFRNQFGIDLFRLRQFRTGRVLMAPCTTEAELAHKLQALADLIDLMNSEKLAQAHGAMAEPGSVNWLAAFLETVAQGDPAPVVQTLRDVRTVRNQLAAHSAAVDGFVDACGRLGIGLPIRDWQDAWRRVLSTFLDALRKLQGLLS